MFIAGLQKKGTQRKHRQRRRQKKTSDSQTVLQRQKGRYLIHETGIRCYKMKHSKQINNSIKNGQIDIAPEKTYR